MDRKAARPAAARAHSPTRLTTLGSDTCPATVLRAIPSRVWMYPNSRSPWAAWFRFMKSMSISDHGRRSFAWVCRCSNGLRSTSIPLIHIFAGLKVCIHATTPMQLSSALASSISRRMAPASVSTGLATTGNGTTAESSSTSDTDRDWSATWRRTSSPYNPWLPVRNHTTLGFSAMPFSFDPDLSGRLPIDVLVSLEERVDMPLLDGDWIAEPTGDVDGASDILQHDRSLHRVTGVLPDREGSVVLHENGLRAAVGQRCHDASTDGIVADDRERAHRDLSPELVGHHRQHARNRLPSGCPGGGICGVRVHHPTDMRHVPIDVGMCGSVRGGKAFALHKVAVQVRDDHALGTELLIGDARGLDDHEVVPRNSGGDVPGGPNHESVARELGVQVGHGMTQGCDRVSDVRPDAHVNRPRQLLHF